MRSQRIWVDERNNITEKPLWERTNDFLSDECTCIRGNELQQTRWSFLCIISPCTLFRSCDQLRRLHDTADIHIYLYIPMKVIPLRFLKSFDDLDLIYWIRLFFWQAGKAEYFQNSRLRIRGMQKKAWSFFNLMASMTFCGGSSWELSNGYVASY